MEIHRMTLTDATGNPITPISFGYTTTSVNFTQPSSSGTVTITVTATQMFTANQIIYIATGGYYQVSSIATGTQMTITNLGYTGNASPSSTITSGALVTAGGIQGATGAAGTNGTNGTNGLNAYTTTTGNFTQPAVSSTVSVSVAATGSFSANEIVYVATGGYYQISSITNSTTFVLTNLGYAGNAASSTTINSGSLVSPGGLSGTNGTNGYLYKGYFGNGNSGVVTISGNTSLTAPQYYSSLTVNNGVTLTPAGYPIHCSGTVTVNGTISAAGCAGGSASGTVQGSGGSTACAAYWGANGYGGCGGPGITSNGNGCYGSCGGTGSCYGYGPTSYTTLTGGSGGNASNSGGPGGCGGYYNTSYGLYRIQIDLLIQVGSGTSGLASYGGGVGGGGGGGGAVNSSGTSGAGGGGGAGGGCIQIFANTITVANTGLITAAGGCGGCGSAATAGNAGGGGGGAGGSGGLIFLMYQTLTNNGTITAAGGSPGNGGAGHGTGNAGNSGPSAFNGIVRAFNPSTGVFDI